MSTVFEAEGKSYEVAFNMQRVDMYEKTNKPIMVTFAMNRGLFSIGELKALVAYGLRPEGGAWVNPKKGIQMAEKLLSTNGYATVLEIVHEALERDCGFFFTMGSGE